MNTRKAAHPDGILDHVLKSFVSQLADVFTGILIMWLAQERVPTCLRTATIVPGPTKSAVSSLSDSSPVAHTHILMKCFEERVSVPHSAFWILNLPSNRL